ncbi:MAG: type II toxin-antitoxin system PemK/MazF family toxin [Labilithrix sp.]|nr:type II toxin-antitoxin system PemK/MazF family toxin [Labilithrix sp.]
MNRGEIWWAELAEPRGSEAASRRPVLIVQDDLLTRSKLRTVMVAPLTTNMLRAKAVGNVALRARDSGLPRDAVVLVCHVMTIDEAFLSECVGTVPRRSMARIDDGLRLALDLL